MSSSSLALLLCLSGAAVLASAQQSVSHFGGGYAGGGGSYAGGRGPALSKYNEVTKNYEPVTSDRQYTYYRIKIDLDQTFIDSFKPNPNSPLVVTIVDSGDLYDNSTGVQVGTYDSYAIVTAAVNATGELQYLVTVATELGPDGDDTRVTFLQTSQNRIGFFGKVTDFDLAVTGGTGRYKGATGEAQHFGADTVSLQKGNLYVMEVAVPKFKRF